MPVSLSEIIPEVLCCNNAATAVTGNGSSFANAGASVSWKLIPNCAPPLPMRAVVEPSGGCTTSTFKSLNYPFSRATYNPV